MPAGFLSIGGLRIRYRREGRGPAVLMLHGWGGSIESFEPLFRAIASQFDATAIDFPGHGQSSLPPGPWRVSDFLDCTLDLMDRLELTQPHIVSHSFGGRVTIKLAAYRPERAGRLLFTAAAGVKPPASARRRLKRLAGMLAGKAERAAVRLAPSSADVFRRLQDRIFPYLASRDYLNAGALRQTLRNVIDEDLTPLLPSIRSRCLLIWGDQDQDTPLSCGETMHRLIPDSRLVVLPGAGHFPYLDQTHKFNLMALRFLRGEDAA